MTQSTFDEKGLKYIDENPHLAAGIIKVKPREGVSVELNPFKLPFKEGDMVVLTRKDYPSVVQEVQSVNYITRTVSTKCWFESFDGVRRATPLEIANGYRVNEAV